jgi:hypothetical protein
MRVCSTAVAVMDAASDPGGSASSVIIPGVARGANAAGRWFVARGRAEEAVDTFARSGTTGPLVASERVVEDIRLTIGFCSTRPDAGHPP